MLEGKRIIATGTGSGIGKAFLDLAAQLGATVTAMDLKEPDGPFADFHPLDLDDYGSIDAAANAITGEIDGLCNIAGVIPPVASPAKTIRINTLGTIRMAETFAPKLTKGGAMVTIASTAGFGWTKKIDLIQRFFELGSPSDVEAFCEAEVIDEFYCYPFSKECLRYWNMLNWKKWRAMEIRSNMLSPGPVDTPLLVNAREMFGEIADFDINVVGRPGQPAEIAGALAFFMSDHSRWCQSAHLYCDGGLSAELIRDELLGTSDKRF